MPKVTAVFFEQMLTNSAFLAFLSSRVATQSNFKHRTVILGYFSFDECRASLGIW